MTAVRNLFRNKTKKGVFITDCTGLIEENVFVPTSCAVVTSIMSAVAVCF